MDDFWKFLTILVAGFATYVAFQQFRLGREKLKLDLFEKRFSVFATTRKFLARLSATRSLPVEEVFQFRVAVAETVFLFDSDITDYLEEMAKRASRLWAIEEKLAVTVDQNERAHLIDESTKEFNWVMEQSPVLTKKFAKYLKFHVWQ